jgi:hypothetical protein
MVRDQALLPEQDDIVGKQLTRGVTMSRFVVALLVVCGLSGPLSAAVIHVRPKLAAVFSPTFDLLDDAAIVDANSLESVRLWPSTDKYIVRIDYLMTIEELIDGQLGFGNVVFNIDLLGVTQSVDAPEWVPDGPPPYDLDGGWPRSAGNKWAGNLDAGLNRADLKFILVESDPQSFFTGIPPGSDMEADPRRTLGMAPYYGPHAEGEFVGSTYIELPGAPGTRGVVKATVLEGSTFNQALMLSALGTTGGAPAKLRISVVPEPATWLLLSVSVVLCASCRGKYFDVCA